MSSSVRGGQSRQLTDDIDQRRDINRLRDVQRETGIAGAVAVGETGVRRHGRDRNPGERGPLPHGREERVPILARHADVHEHHRRSPQVEDAQGFGDRRRLIDGGAAGSKGGGHHVARPFAIFHHQHTNAIEQIARRERPVDSGRPIVERIA